MVAPRREEDGEYPSVAFPGGYPIYYICEDSGVLCPDCVNNNEEVYSDEDDRKMRANGEGPHYHDPQWHIVAVEIHEEGLPLTCDHCGKEIPSSYGPTDYDYKDMVEDWFRQHLGSVPSKEIVEKAIAFIREKDTESEGNWHKVGEWVREFIHDNMGDNQGVAGRRQERKLNYPIVYEGNSYGHYLVTDIATGKTRYFQTDYDFPGLATTFGWNGKVLPDRVLRGVRIDPKDKTGAQIYSAIQYLDANEGKQVEDPGYFDEDGVGRRQKKPSYFGDSFTDKEIKDAEETLRIFDSARGIDPCACGPGGMMRGEAVHILETAGWVISSPGMQGVSSIISRPTSRVMSDTKYDVYLRGRLVDTVFYQGESTEESVKKDLVEHDGYDRNIVVVKARQ